MKKITKQWLIDMVEKNKETTKIIKEGQGLFPYNDGKTPYIIIEQISTKDNTVFFFKDDGSLLNKLPYFNKESNLK